MDIEFEELANDADLVTRVKNFHEATENINNLLKLANDPTLYDKLSNTEKLKYNLLMSFGLNSLFWMYLRLEGEDPLKHDIKSENDRLKQYMVRAKQVNDRNTIMPRVNRDTAQRFVRSGLWEPRENRDKNSRNSRNSRAPNTG